MEPGARFGAPWGSQVRVVSTIIVLVMIAIPVVTLTQKSDPPIPLILVSTLAPLAVVLVSGLFAVRGYVVSGKRLIVERLGGNKRIDLSDLESIKADPESMKGSIRIFGNTGVFSITGIFRNRRLGTYTAYATDRERAVVLRFPKKIIVVTPDKPQQFIARLQERLRASGKSVEVLAE